jgi:pimeloyl-ACP methyl ester carboxylesterase
MTFSLSAGLGLLTLGLAFAPLRAPASPLHADVLVFVPAYEGSQLFDDNLKGSHDPTCVWGNLNVFFCSKLYFALRMPNPLEARTMRSVGPVDIYGRFISTLTRKNAHEPGFSPYKPGADFFVFNYDWRQDMSRTADDLARALDRYAAIHAAHTGIPAGETRFVIVTHSMGGLVARTLLGAHPRWAPRLAQMYLVGSPNTGSVKAIKTIVYGPDSIKAHATGFPGALLNLLPTNVDQNVTKLTGITRPSLYELLPFGDPHWTSEVTGRTPRRMTADDLLQAASWEPYWPTAALEKRVYIDGWLKTREAEGRKKINPPDWEFCQDPHFGPLKKLLAQTQAWHDRMGTLHHALDLMTQPGEATRLHLIVGTGLETPSGVVTTGDHDTSQGSYTYLEGDGDGTVETRRNLDGVPATAPNVKLLHNIPHGQLMGSAPFLKYIVKELASQPMAPAR